MTATNIMTPRPPRPAEYSRRIQPDCSSSSKSVNPNYTRSKYAKNNENSLSRAAAETPRCRACRARARAAHGVIGDVGHEIRPGRSNEVYDGGERERLCTKPLMRKRRNCAKSSTLRKRRGTGRESRTANTRHRGQRSWSPVLDLVVVDAQESGHWFI